MLKTCNKQASKQHYLGTNQLDSPFGQETDIGNIDDDDIHVLNVIEFQAMIKNLQRLNALAGQRFDEKNGFLSRG